MISYKKNFDFNSGLKYRLLDMILISLALVTVLVHAYPQNFQDDILVFEPIEDDSSVVNLESIEDNSSVFNLDGAAVLLNGNLFSEGTLVSSVSPSIDDAEEDLFSSSIDSEDFGTYDDGLDIPSQLLDSSLLVANGEEKFPISNVALSLESNDSEENPPLDIFDSSIATTNCNSEADGSTEIFASSDSTSFYDLNEGSVFIAGSQPPAYLPRLPC